MQASQGPCAASSSAQQQIPVIEFSLSKFQLNPKPRYIGIDTPQFTIHGKTQSLLAHIRDIKDETVTDFGCAKILICHFPGTGNFDALHHEHKGHEDIIELAKQIRHLEEDEQKISESLINPSCPLWEAKAWAKEEGSIKHLPNATHDLTLFREKHWTAIKCRMALKVGNFIYCPHGASGRYSQSYRTGTSKETGDLTIYPHPDGLKSTK